MAQDDIQGQVVDASGNPISGAIVELTRSYQSSPTTEETVVRTTTDADGNYIFESHPDGDGTTLEYHVSCYNYDGTAYVNSENNPGVTADLSASAIPDSGTYLYLSDGASVKYYSLSTPYDLSTRTEEHVLDSFSSASVGVTVSYEGDYAFVLNAEVDELFYRYDLSTPYGLSTATEAQSESFSYGDYYSGIAISKDGSTMWVGGDEEIATYSMSTAFDLTTLTQESVDTMPASQVSTNDAVGIGSFAFNQDGTKVFYGMRNTSEIYEASLSTPFDVGTASETTYISVTEDPNGVTMSFDGTKLYSTHYSPNDIFEYDLSTAFDLSTADSGTSQFVKDSFGTSIQFNLPPRYA